MQKNLQTKIKKLQTKISNLNLWRHIYMVPPIGIAFLSLLACLINLLFNFLVAQGFGIATVVVLTGNIIANRNSDNIDLAFAKKIQKLTKELEKTEAEYANSLKTLNEIKNDTYSKEKTSEESQLLSVVDIKENGDIPISKTKKSKSLEKENDDLSL